MAIASLVNQSFSLKLENFSYMHTTNEKAMSANYYYFFTRIIHKIVQNHVNFVVN